MKPLRAARAGLLLPAVVALVAAIAGGLARLGAVPPVLTTAEHHAALMIGGFLGTVISLERAVALDVRWPYGAPLCAGLGALAVLAGLDTAASVLRIAAPVVFLGASLAIVRRQLMLPTVLLAVAAACWLAASVLAGVVSEQAAIAPWFAFLVLTIAAERLEMTRVARRPAAATPLFVVATVVLVGGALLSQLAFGVGLVLMALWLAAFDVARRTIRAHGFARYSAIALIAGYAWLGAGGIGWLLAHEGWPVPRDFALHALGLGFVFSMIMAHAPLVVPAIARIPMRFTLFFYVPLALLHASLALRLFGGATDFAIRRMGGIMNATSIAVFAATVVFCIARGKDEP